MDRRQRERYQKCLNACGRAAADCAVYWGTDCIRQGGRKIPRAKPLPPLPETTEAAGRKSIGKPHPGPSRRPSVWPTEPGAFHRPVQEQREEVYFWNARHWMSYSGNPYSV